VNPLHVEKTRKLSPELEIRANSCHSFETAFTALVLDRSLVPGPSDFDDHTVRLMWASTVSGVNPQTLLRDSGLDSSRRSNCRF
jgi:hypothetical protein